VFALSSSGGENDLLRVKKGRWNKNVWETLVWTFSQGIGHRTESQIWTDRKR